MGAWPGNLPYKELALRVLRARYRTGEDFLRHYQPAFAAGGLFFPTREVLPVGETVLIEVRFPSLANKTVLRGQIAWCRAGKHRTKIRAGLGIEFQPSEARRRDFLISVAKGLTSAQDRAVVQRRHRRVPVTLPVQWRPTQERELRAGHVEDIGPGGAFLRSPALAPVGTDVVLEVIPPGSVRPVEIAGRVAWASETGAGFGVEFRSRDAGGMRRLKELVRRLEEMEDRDALESDLGGDGDGDGGGDSDGEDAATRSTDSLAPPKE